MLIKTTFDCGVQSTEITSLENQPSIAGTTENPIPSFFCSESERISVLLVKTTDERTFVRFQIDDDCEEHVYYQYICRDNVPLFVYFTTQSMDSQRYDEGFLEIYTIFIVYQDEIVKLCLKKEFATHLEFESCNFHRMSLFNGMFHLELKNRVFARHPVIPHGMKGLEVRVERDGVEVIQVIEFIFDLDQTCSGTDVLNTRFDVTIKMTRGFSSGEILEECVGSFLVTGTTEGGAEKGWICIFCDPDIDHDYPSTNSRCSLIYQTRYGYCDQSFTVLIDDDDDHLKSQVENASCLHQKVGALIVSFKKPQIFQELLKEHPYCPQSDESDQDD